MGLQPLLPVLQRDPVKPLLAVASHIHVEHVGSFHSFSDRLGSVHSEESFATMPDAATLAHLFRSLPDALQLLPSAGWQAETYSVPPAPLTRTLRHGNLVDLGDRGALDMVFSGF